MEGGSTSLYPRVEHSLREHNNEPRKQDLDATLPLRAEHNFEPREKGEKNDDPLLPRALSGSIQNKFKEKS